MVFHVVRTAFDKKTFATVKVQTLLETDASVDMRPYLLANFANSSTSQLEPSPSKSTDIASTSVAQTDSSSTSSMYNLVGVVNHHGKGYAFVLLDSLRFIFIKSFLDDI